MEHSITIPFQARYFSIGDRSTPRQIWFVLHGYGQLASYFIRKFASLEEEKILVIAPEALSRFYLQDTEERMRTGNTRVGSSWMTREDRLTDIRNYINFLNAIYRVESRDPNIPATVLGFSQGAATATRWVLDGNISFRRLILWAGILPPDIDFSTGREILKDKETVLVYGDEDPFTDDARFAEMETLSKKIGISPSVIRFKGGHTIDAQTLLKLL